MRLGCKTALVAGALAGWIASGAGVVASAAPTYAIYTGTIDRSENPLGLFGTTGSLTGDEFTVIYTINYQPAFVLSNDPSRASELVEGIYNSREISPVTAKVIVNGHIISFVNYSAAYDVKQIVRITYGLDFRSTLAAGYSQIFDEVDGYSDTSQDGVTLANDIYSNINPIVTNAVFNGPSQYTVQSGDIGDGGLFYSLAQPGYDGAVVTLAHFNTTSVRIFTPVPEPTTWTQMLIGAFGLGAIARRARHHRQCGRFNRAGARRARSQAHFPAPGRKAPKT